jgi:hypothetical protein
MIKSLRCLIRFFSFLPFTLPLFGWLAGIGSPGLHITQKCGPVDQQKQHPPRQPNGDYKGCVTFRMNTRMGAADTHNSDDANPK